MKYVALLFFVFTCFYARPSVACDCRSGPTEASLNEQATIIVVGRALRQTTKAVEVQVLAAWRGAKAGDTLRFAAPKTNCDHRFVLGFNYLIYSDANRSISQCSAAVALRLPTNENLGKLGKPLSFLSDATLARCPCAARQPFRARRPTIARDTEAIAMQTVKGQRENRYLWRSELAPTWSAVTSDMVRKLGLPTEYWTPALGCTWQEPSQPWQVANGAPLFPHISACSPPVLVRQ